MLLLAADLVEWPVIIGSLEAVGIGWLYRTMGGLLIDGLLGTVGLDSYFGLDSARLDLRGIDPSYGKVGLAVAVNETLEVVRFPIAVATIRPVLRLLGRLPK